MILYTNADVVTSEERFRGYVGIDDGLIVCVGRGEPDLTADQTIDLGGDMLMPGVIDTHVHFREPGLTQKADIHSESVAAAAGGVTTVVDMPNVVPPTLTAADVDYKLQRAAAEQIDYRCYIGAGPDNLDELSSIDNPKVPGIKLFMGASTGNMAVTDPDLLDRIFSLGRLVAVHCEDNEVIARNAAAIRQRYPDGEVPVTEHPHIRSAEACIRSTDDAVARTRRLGTRLHVLHVSTADELKHFSPGPIEQKQITAEACVGHLLWCSDDYSRLGTKMKCNPAIKDRHHRDALRRALLDGTIDVVSTDHAPHLPADKVGGALSAASGFPSIQYSLIAMLDLTGEVPGLTPSRIATLMSLNQAKLLGLTDRGDIRPGMKAHMVRVRKEQHTVTRADILSKCGWSPFEGHTFGHRVVERYFS